MLNIEDLSRKMEDKINSNPPHKRQRTITIANDTSGSSTDSTASPQNEGLLDEEVAAATQKQENEILCPLYKVSDDAFGRIFGYVGEKQYGFVACTSYRFHQVYLDTFGSETLTSFTNAAVSVSCAKLCLATSTIERPKALFYTAARDGKLNVLKWGKDSGYDLKKMLNAEAIAMAAWHGHLEVVQYLRMLDISWDELTCAHAAFNGHLELLIWARAKKCPWNEGTCASAAQNGHLETLKWARAKKCPWNDWTCSKAAENGHLELLKWARANQCLWDKRTCSSAAFNGHLALLKWARANQCPWHVMTCSNAAINGHLALLKWARANQCPWDEWTCAYAAQNGHLELLKWARENGCPWDVHTHDFGRRNGDPALLRYLEDEGCPRYL